MKEEEVNEPGILAILSQKQWSVIKFSHLIPPGLGGLSGLALVSC